MGNYYERIKVIRRKYLKYFPAGCKMLDVGCAEGTLIRYLSEEGYVVSGVDSDERHTRVASDRQMSVFKQDAIVFLQGNKAAYEGIVCSHVLEHIPVDRVELFIASCYEALVRGGVLLIITPNVHTLTGCADFWNDPSHVRPFSLWSLEKLLTSAGFRMIDIGYDEDTKHRARKDIIHGAVDMLRLVAGFSCYGKAAFYTEIFAVVSRSV